MKLYGEGALCFPASSRVAHDFEDGPFDTDDPDLIAHALKQGCKTEPVKDQGPDPIPPWTVVRLKERLGELGISIPRGASKDEMIALLPEVER